MVASCTIEEVSGGYVATVADGSEAVRLFEFLCAALPDVFPTATAAKHACRNRHSCNYVVDVTSARASSSKEFAETGDTSTRQALVVNCNTSIIGGDIVKVSRKTVTPLPVSYTDADVCVIHKPAGMTMHGPGARTFKSRISEQIPGALPMHRLDELTEGLVICCRNPPSVHSLQEQFENRTISKRYLAVVYGYPGANSGECNEPVEGREALTHWRIRWQGLSIICGPVSCLEVFPKTGRQHQIRQHLSQLGHPIVGDPLFPLQGISRQQQQRQPKLLLAAVEVRFCHPVSRRSISVSLLQEGTCSIVSDNVMQSQDLRKGLQCEDVEQRFRKSLMLLSSESNEAVLCHALRAGQKQSNACSARWTADCIARGSTHEKDPFKAPLHVLHTFFVSVRDEFADEPWFKCAQYHLHNSSLLTDMSPPEISDNLSYDELGSMIEARCRQ